MGLPIGPGEALAGLRQFARLPAFLRHPVSPDEARTILRARLEHRADDLLALARHAIYGRPASPYLQLLRLAGCEYGDLERLVRAEGVEGALRVLYRQGAYLTVDEMKGRRPAVRGSAAIRVDLEALRSPLAGAAWTARSSGSRGQPTSINFDLSYIRDRAVASTLILQARGGGRRWSNAVWGLAGGSFTLRVLEFCAAGAPPVRWFSPLHPGLRRVHVRYGWTTRAVRLASLLAGVPLPGPEVVPLDRPAPVVNWMAGVVREGGTPHLHTTASCAIRVALAAVEAGVSLRGAHFTMAGEPVTPARLATIRRSGAEAMVKYGAIETGPLSYGCLASETTDDMHLLHDSNAVIRAGSVGPEQPLSPDTLLFSSLRPTVPRVLFNVSLGDQAELVERACGCSLERLGWNTHLQAIRSYEKLTAGGMTFLDTDVARVLEEALPARFGGGPLDYQLVEAESEDGLPSVTLLVHPAIGPVYEAAVAETFLAEIGRGSATEQVMALQWRQAGLPRVERRAPHATSTGKVLHLHREMATSHR